MGERLEEIFQMRGFRIDKTIELAPRLKAFLKVDAGITRGTVPDLPQQAKAQNRQLEDLRRQTKSQKRQLERIRQMLSERDLHGALWEASKGEEVSFWQEWIATKGLGWPDDYKRRLDPEQPLQDDIIRHLSARPGSTVSILDVGAGPMTKLGKRWEGRTVQITAVDPLADDYEHFLAEAGITPLVPTQPGEAEQLADHFPINHFDLVYVQNALDHSRDPLLGIRQMLEVVKPGCFVCLYHNRNAGLEGNYEGLHQWNFRADNGHFVIRDRRTHVSVNEALGDLAEITVEEHEGGVHQPEGEIFVYLKKKP
jgi:SAM-dependent methyltransferase